MRAVVLAAAAASCGAHGASSVPRELAGRRLVAGRDGFSAVSPGERVVAALHARRLPAANSDYWTTEHHDGQNSGRTPAIGPADSSGSCRASFFQPPPQADDAAQPLAAAFPRFFSTGVGSSDNLDNNEYLYFGGTDNQLRVVSGSARVAGKISTLVCNLTVLNPVGAPPSEFGIVASPTAWDVNNDDRLAVASGDGWVYVLNMEECLQDPAVCVPGDGAVVSGAEGGAAPPRLRRASSASSAASCVQATAQLPGGRVGLSPPRYLSPLESGLPSGLLLVVASLSLIAGGDVLVAYPGDVAGGAPTPLWTFDPASLGQTASLRGIIPGLTPNFVTSPLLFLPIGQGVAVLNATTGAVVSSYIDALTLDALSSSPVITSDGSALLVHGSSGSLHKFAVAQNGSLTHAWACDYTQAVYEAGGNPCVLGGPDGRLLSLPEEKEYVVGGVMLVARRGEFVHGGAPRPSTTSQVASLHTAITRAYEGVHGLGSAAGVHAPTPSQRMQALASALPRAALVSLGLVSSSLTIPDLGLFPFATPALASDALVVLPQYSAPGVGAQGLYASSVVTGQPSWAFFGQSFAYFGVNVSLPFGRSRSSPAVDGKGAFYVGADIDWPFAEDPQGNDTMPTLFAFRTSPVPGKYDFAWSWNMGSQADVPLGAASPVLRVGVYNDQEVLMTAFDGAVSITEGAVCDSDVPELECSGHGVCDCARGSCECAPCYSGKGCADYNEGCGTAAATALSPETIGAAVGLPLGLVALGFMLYLYRKQSAALWQTMLPAGVANRAGVNFAAMPLVNAAAGADTAYGSASSSKSVKEWGAGGKK